ncbi:hypothetical protein ACFO4N_02415 [Camelliibacillus cellulosilyticus]|uniref:Uncharacterized protein n=1 Tax=Camelliibacillus cellulosilyticus TaxID=2174486 RepID=A0ABV9GK72_9BACL
MNRQDLKNKVVRSAGKLLNEKGYVSPVDLFLEMDKLSKKDYEAWRKKQIFYLERVIKGHLNQFSFIMKVLKTYAHEQGLKPSWTAYQSWGKGQKVRLRFSKSGDPNIEKAYATHFVKPRIKK